MDMKYFYDNPIHLEYLRYHPRWYKELYGDKTPEVAGCHCDEGSGYDDEDK